MKRKCGKLLHREGKREMKCFKNILQILEMTENCFKLIRQKTNFVLKVNIWLNWTISSNEICLDLN